MRGGKHLRDQHRRSAGLAGMSKAGSGRRRGKRSNQGPDPAQP